MMKQKSMNIFTFESIIKAKDRHTLNKHRSGLLWFAGLSGSGKSTLANAVEARLYEMDREIVEDTMRKV